MPQDVKLRSIAEQFRIPRAVSQNFIMVSIGLDFYANSHPEVAWACAAAKTAKPWFLTMYLLSAVLNHNGRQAKLDALKDPEVKLLNVGVVASGLLLAFASAAGEAAAIPVAAAQGSGLAVAGLAGAEAAVAGAVNSGLSGIAGLTGLAAVLPALKQFFTLQLVAVSPPVPLSIIVLMVLPSVRSLFKSGVSGVVPMVREHLVGLKDELLQSAAKTESEEKDESERGFVTGGPNLLVCGYGLLAIEAFASAFSRPTTLPLLRAAVFMVLFRNARSGGGGVLATDKFKFLNSGILTSTIAFFGTSGAVNYAADSAGRLVAGASLVAAFAGGNKHTEARKARDEADKLRTAAA